jgi:diacylglycerol kinase (ATP)
LILVLGGDGTINEAANGMIGSQAHLGVLPSGTANVLAMELGLGSNLERAIRRLSRCTPKRISAGKIWRSGEEPRHFLMMAGAGFDAQVVIDLKPGLKSKTGKFAYWVAGFSQIVKRVGQLETRINGDTYPCGFLLAARVRNYGGDLELASGASLLRNDFETVMFEGSNPLRYLFYMLAVSVRQVQRMPGVHTVRSTRIEVLGDAPMQIDGEYVGRSPATIEIVPDALTILVPESYG